MSSDNKSSKYSHISYVLFTASKILGYLTVLGFIAGVFQGEFLVGIMVAMLFAVPAAICFFISMKLGEKVTQIKNAIASEKLLERERTYEKNKHDALKGYEKVCTTIQKPATTYSIDAYIFSTENDLEILQNGGRQWQYFIRTCDCWLHMVSEEYNVGALYLMESLEFFDSEVRRSPDPYSDLETSAGRVWSAIIPLHEIIGLSVIGDVETTSTVSGGDAKYMGVSVNGIGFGEWQVDPVRVHHDIYDKRVLELKYNDENEIRTIFFPLEAAAVLEEVMETIN